MKECLDEGTLQGYFDGELPIEMMESVTVHLSSCVTCAAAARELEDETALLSTALAAEFNLPVPTEQLRRRINLAVADVNAPVAVEKRTLFGSFANLFNFAPQQSLGYAGLIIVLVFAAVFGVLKLRHTEQPQQPGNTAVAVNAGSKTPEVRPAPAAATDKTNPPVASAEQPRPVRVAHRFSPTTPKPAPKPAPVKLLPGERAYLQTIARLDSAIKADKNMRPTLEVEYRRNLAVVDHAIAATRTAAKNNPNNPDAADFMFAAYQSKVDLLNTIADARVGGRSH